MPQLTRTQATEHMNRLFPGANWQPDDFGLYEVTYENGARPSTPIRLWLPTHAPNIAAVARYRLGLPDTCTLTLERVDMATKEGATPAGHMHLRRALNAARS